MINGDGECSLLAAYKRAQADWLGPKIGGPWRSSAFIAYTG